MGRLPFVVLLDLGFQSLGISVCLCFFERSWSFNARCSLTSIVVMSARIVSKATLFVLLVIFRLLCGLMLLLGSSDQVIVTTVLRCLQFVFKALEFLWLDISTLMGLKIRRFSFLLLF